MKQVKLMWSDLLNLWLWHSRPNDDLVNDDLAYVACLRIQKFVEYALWSMERPVAPEGSEQK